MVSMPKVAIVVGVVLTAQATGFYYGTGGTSLTALIPAVVGIPILVLGLVALGTSQRKHAMHVAAVLGVLGFLAPIGRLASAGLTWSPAVASQLMMLLLCGGFVALCIKSFIDARRERQDTNGSGNDRR